MRDALSILDKIVSFTNGELSYQNTLEHLNILDADNYFKFIDAMLQQDLAAVMLLYDDINRKGFEGDIVLNGFSEFMRNVLVCKDERIANLLEVVESFKDKYIATAKKLSPSWIISALNILNEAELNYKAARNKKLHVELTLIKLAYLSQVVELVNEGGISKKKITDIAKPVAFKQINPVEVKKESQKEAVKAQAKAAADAKLIIETSVLEEPQAAYGKKSPATSNPTSPQAKEKQEPVAQPVTTLGALSKIRKEIAQRHAELNDTAINVTAENVQQAWGLYIEKLTEQKNHSAITNFRLAKLQVVDANTFEISVESNIQQKFIEQERGALIEHLQKFYNNRTLSYNITIEENTEAPVQQERPMNSREQFIKMVEEYPFVKELKDRLRLELDY